MSVDRERRLRDAVETLQHRIGERLEPVTTTVVDDTMVSRFLRAVGSPARRDATLVPLSYLAHVGFEPVDVLQDARPDETLGGALIDVLNGGTTIVRHRPAPIGVALTRTVTLKRVELRNARSGPLAAVVVAIAITDADGPIGTAERTMLYRDVRS